MSSGRKSTKRAGSPAGNGPKRPRAGAADSATEGSSPEHDNGDTSTSAGKQPANPAPPLQAARNPSQEPAALLPVREFNDMSLHSVANSLRDFGYIPDNLLKQKWWTPSLIVDRVKGFYPPFKLPLELTEWGTGGNPEFLYIETTPVMLQVFARITKSEMCLPHPHTPGNVINNTHPGVRFEALRESDHEALRKIIVKKSSDGDPNVRSTFRTSAKSFDWAPRGNKVASAGETRSSLQIARPWPHVHDGLLHVRPPNQMKVLPQSNLKANDVVILTMAVQRFKVQHPEADETAQTNREVWANWMVRFALQYITKIWTAPKNAPVTADEENADRIEGLDDVGLSF